MHRRWLVFVVLVLLAGFSNAQDQAPQQSRLVLDDNLWVTFYDLPSRRFRDIRTAVLARNTEAASRDLTVSANYISVEADRAADALRGPLQDVVARLRALSEDTEFVSMHDLDVLFGRTHWLLAQHYVVMARQARDARNNQGTSLFLWATTHHMERAILWSKAPITRDVHATLESLRDIAGRLQGATTFEQAYKEKPVVRAEQLLRKIGKDIDRPVLIPASPDVGSVAPATDRL